MEINFDIKRKKERKPTDEIIRVIRGCEKRKLTPKLTRKSSGKRERYALNDVVEFGFYLLINFGLMSKCMSERKREDDDDANVSDKLSVSQVLNVIEKLVTILGFECEIDRVALETVMFV